MVNTEQIATIDYRKEFESFSRSLNWREKSLVESMGIYNQKDAENAVDLLTTKGFVLCNPSKVLMGNEKGMPCRIEESRLNETPQRLITNVPSFYASKFTVTNKEFELFDKQHRRPATSPDDDSPVTCITYGKAISYCLWLNQETGLKFRLPTEPEYVAFSAPEGWAFPYQASGKPIQGKQNSFMAFVEDNSISDGGTLPVNSELVPENYLGIKHATGNVSVFSFGHFRQNFGQWGSSSDGAYTVILGGGFRQCDYGGRVVTRGLIDVSSIIDSVGIRLVHPNPFSFLDP